jgi:hypothetical protein
VQQQEVERVDADALQGALGGHLQVRRIFVSAAQRRIREAREALRPVALALVEVVPHGSDQAVGVARQPLERASQQGVGLALAVDVCRQDRPDALIGAVEREQPVVVDLLTEVHETPAAPGAERCPCGNHAFRVRTPGRG